MAVELARRYSEDEVEDEDVDVDDECVYITLIMMSEHDNDADAAMRTTHQLFRRTMYTYTHILDTDTHLCARSSLVASPERAAHNAHDFYCVLARAMLSERLSPHAQTQTTHTCHVCVR